jgi:uncharacterized membrane protein YdjX (TVP38/TMEM64 family)
VALRQLHLDLDNLPPQIAFLSGLRASNAALVAGALFGVWQGLLLVSFASTIGATLAFLAARHLSSDWVHDRMSAKASPRDEGLARDGGFDLFTLRPLPGVPFFAGHLSMGLTSIRTLTFYPVRKAGMLAGAAVFVSAGTRLARIDNVSDIGSPGLVMPFAQRAAFPGLPA